MAEEKIRSIHEWIGKNKFVNEKGDPIRFDNHMFLVKPYSDFSKYQTYKKAAQIGVSVMKILKAVFAAKMFKWNIIYTLPSDSDVWEFVPSKVDKIIQQNPLIREMLSTDKVEMKQIANRFIYYKGTRSKTAPIMTTADLLIHDEKDRSDQGILGTYRSRTKFSKYGGLWTLSNPSVSKFGVDLDWRISNRQEWMIRCDKCKTEQILRWDRNVNEQKGIYECVNCKKEITDNERRLGDWVAGNPNAEISGYHISQLMAPWINAKQLIKDRGETDEEYFNNFVLGEPVDAGDVERFRQFILDSWTPKSIDKKLFYMGIDVGRIKHYVLGSDEGIFKVGKCESREEIEGLIQTYNPMVVMDAGPERTWAEEFRKKYPKFYICFFRRDKDRKTMIEWGEDKDSGIVWADRNRSIDGLVNDLARGEILFDVEPKMLERYIKHWETMVRIKETTPLGIDRFIWDKATSTQQDHWAFATLYYWIAKKRSQAGSFVSGPGGKKVKFITQTKEGFTMGDLEEFFNSGNYAP